MSLAIVTSVNYCILNTHEYYFWYNPRIHWIYWNFVYYILYIIYNILYILYITYLRKILGMTTTYCTSIVQTQMRRLSEEQTYTLQRTIMEPKLNQFRTFWPIVASYLQRKFWDKTMTALWEWSISKKIPPHLLRYCFDGSADPGNNGYKPP